MARIYVCGEALIDFVPVDMSGGDGFLALPGGSPFNTAKAAALAETDVRFLGPLSNDLFGDRLWADLQVHGVSTDLTPRSDDPSTLAFVDTSSGEPKYAFFDRQSAAANMAPHLDGVPVGTDDILAVGSISLIPNPGADNILRFALSQSQKMMLAFDPNVRANMIDDRAGWEARVNALFLASAIVKISSEDLEFLRPNSSHAEFAEYLLRSGTDLVVITSGQKGATAWTTSENVHVASPKVEVVDTVGAGDTFMGNLLAGVVRAGCANRAALSQISADGLKDILRHAAWAAALNCMRMGCKPPTLEETKQALSKGG